MQRFKNTLQAVDCSVLTVKPEGFISPVTVPASHQDTEATTCRPADATSRGQGYRRILVATDFSPPADAAFQQAVWLARQAGARIVLAHTLPDLRGAIAGASPQARQEWLYGEDDLFQREVREDSDAKLRRMILNANASDLDVRFETLLGRPFVELTHAVQAEGYDLVLAGTRGLAAWEQFFVGSTSQRLIRKCPTAVWIVKAEHAGPPKVVLVATDFSEVSCQAVRQALWVAQQANAALHLLHVLDFGDLPEGAVSKMSPGGVLRPELREDVQARLDAVLESVQAERTQITVHVSSGTPWIEVGRLARQLAADLIVLGTVGRSGIKGLLLGNTAERVLNTCDCSVLTVKPDGFISPIDPAFWPLHPAPKSDTPMPEQRPET